MTSKEALERLLDDYEYLMEEYYPIRDIRNQQIVKTRNNIHQIKQDLERLAELEKENQVLREKVNHFKNVKNRYRRNEKFVENENILLKKTLKILEEKLERALEND